MVVSCDGSLMLFSKKRQLDFQVVTMATNSDQDGKGFESVSEDSQRNDNSVEDMEVKFDDTDTLRDVEIEDLACWDNWDVE